MEIKIVNWTKLLLKWPDVESWITRGNWFFSTKENRYDNIIKISERLRILEELAKEETKWSKEMENILNLNNNEIKDDNIRNNNIMTWAHDSALRNFIDKANLSTADGKGLY